MLECGGLSFRDFHDFNLALLAKQMWRFLKYPHSLLARILKGSYYRHSSPMMINSVSNPSYGWRSIIAARLVLQQGLRKKNWERTRHKSMGRSMASSNSSETGESKNLHCDPELRVHHLIDFDSKTWNLEILNVFVDATDIPMITSLRISRTGRPDSFCWDFTKSGLYTVKSGYEVAHEIRTRSAVPLILEPSTTVLKKAIWKVKAPRKLKHFLWQAISGFLATAYQLKQRHCSQDSSCPRCGADEETINHNLFLCPPALQCWALSAVPSPPGIFPCQSLYENINYLLHRAKERRMDSTMLEAFPWTAWYIWKARNEKTFNGKDIAPADTIQVAQKEAESWKLAQIITEITETQTEDQPVQAKTPQTSTIQKWRCQVDASWKSTTEATGLGFVLLEDDTPTLFGMKGNIKTASPLHAEAEGMLWAM